jgi:hypothetical protein
LNQRRRETEELLTSRSQPGSGLVPDEDLAIELLLENLDPCADSGLGHVQICGGTNEAACLHDLEEGPGHIDVHPKALRRS